MSNFPEKLARCLNYPFTRPELLEMALTHRSFASKNNERLEFLGDAVLSCVIANELYQRFPHANEGELSRMRSNLVNTTVLAEIAHAINLGEYLRLGRGELKTGGMHRQSILADCLEALIGAIYLDGGISIITKILLPWFEVRLQNVNQVQTLKDAKSRLQEYLQKQAYPLPIYRVLWVKGAAHEQIFHVICEVEAVNKTTEGNGTSRRLAEHEAAEKMLQELKANII